MRKIRLVPVETLPTKKLVFSKFVPFAGMMCFAHRHISLGFVAFFSSHDRPVRPSKRLESEITTVIAGATALGLVIPGFSVVTTPPGKGTSSNDTLIRPHSKHHACKASAEHTRRAQARWQPQHG
jgi:hypothetical protein